MSCLSEACQHWEIEKQGENLNAPFKSVLRQSSLIHFNLMIEAK